MARRRMLRPMTTSAARIIDWLTRDAPAQDLPALVEGLAQRLQAEDVPLWRVLTFSLVLHPEIIGSNALWQRGAPTVSFAVSRSYAAEQEDSPIGDLTAGKFDELRERLDGASRYEVLRELAEKGGTDYLMLLLPFSCGRRGMMSFTSDAPDGFAPGHLELLRAIVPTLALRMELASALHATRGLLDLYIGHNAARRVLGGAFHRGSGEVIRAVIWYCDLRGFTSLVDTSPVHEVLAVLDAYFDCVARPVTAAGGEILKFIGDAMLAIFPIGADGPREPACRALDPAVAALEGIAAMDHRLQIGVAVHLGEVMYGNIGASDRLDFTVIGAAVNEVTRVEQLCKPLQTPLLFTAAVAAASLDPRRRSLGHHPLRGVTAPAELFTLAMYHRG